MQLRMTKMKRISTFIYRNWHLKGHGKFFPHIINVKISLHYILNKREFPQKKEIKRNQVKHFI